MVTSINCNVVSSCLTGDICRTLFPFSLSSFHVNALLSTMIKGIKCPKYAWKDKNLYLNRLSALPCLHNSKNAAVFAESQRNHFTSHYILQYFLFCCICIKQSNHCSEIGWRLHWQLDSSLPQTSTKTARELVRQPTLAFLLMAPWSLWTKCCLSWACKLPLTAFFSPAHPLRSLNTKGALFIKSYSFFLDMILNVKMFHQYNQKINHCLLLKEESEFLPAPQVLLSNSFCAPNSLQWAKL